MQVPAEINKAARESTTERDGFVAKALGRNSGDVGSTPGSASNLPGESRSSMVLQESKQDFGII